MEVRILTEADGEAFWTIRLRALRDDPESFGSSYEEILERGIAGATQSLRKRDTSPDDATFGAFEGGTLVGIAGFRREEEVKKRHKGVIWGMYVPREMRGKGIGKALLQAAIAYAKTLPQLEQINLSVVLTSRDPARADQLERCAHQQGGPPTLYLPRLRDLWPGTPRPQVARSLF